jgi:hypothetical protein
MNLANIVVTPHSPELGTESAELIDERLDLRRGPGTRGLNTECTHDVACHALPVIL